MPRTPVWRRYLRFFGSDLQSDIEDELRFHLETKIRELVKHGLTVEDARAEAQRQFGDVEEIRRICERWGREKERTMERKDRWNSWQQDLRYAARTLRKDLGFSSIAVLMLALGIGATISVFSLVHSLLVRPLPFSQPERLVWIENTFPHGANADLSAITTSADTLRVWQRSNRSFESLAGYFAFFGYAGRNLTVSGGQPERLSSLPVTETFFSTLGVKPALGRPLLPEEFQKNGRKAVLLSDGLWRRRFAANPAIVGTAIILNSEPVIVAGVMPATFDFSSTFTPGAEVDLFEPFPINDETASWGNTLAVVGRLKPGIGVAVAQAEIDALTHAYQQQRPDHGKNYGGSIKPLREQISGQVRRPLAVLSGAVGLVLLIVCANLSNLLLARSTVRQKEMAVRAALGAGRGRLIRQLLTESLLLSLTGTLIGLPIAYGITRLVARLQGGRIPMLGHVEVDLTALGFAILISVLTGLLFGLAPALALAGSNLHTSLKEGSRGSSSGSARGWTRRLLVISEVALASLLLVGAGLLVRSFVRLMDTERGFRAEHLATVRLDLIPAYNDRQKMQSFLDELRRRVAAIPGVDGVGLTDALPLDRDRSWGFGEIGNDKRPEEQPDGFVCLVSPGYLETMGIPLLSGRTFTARDAPDHELTVLLSRAAAQRLWGNQNSIGRMVWTGSPKPRRVIGVVGDVRHTSLDVKPALQFYLPVAQNPMSSLDLVARTSLNPASIASALRETVRSIDAGQPIGKFRTMDDLVARAVSPRRFLLLLLCAFAILALALASLGIYGVISYGVTQRRQEIGIRMALGASGSSVQRNVVQQAVGLTAVGICVGGIGAWILSRLLGSLLYEVAPTDPATFAVMGIILLAVAGLAGYGPSRRAASVDPSLALRSQ